MAKLYFSEDKSEIVVFFGNSERTRGHIGTCNISDGDWYAREIIL